MPQSSVESILSQVNSLSPAGRQAVIEALGIEGAVFASARRSAYGKYAGSLTPVGKFLRLKHAEAEREDRGIVHRL